MQEKRNKPASKFIEILLRALVCLVFVAVLGGALAIFLLELKQNREARGWPRTTGRVISSAVNEVQGIYDSSFYFDVSYEYQVDGKHLTGSDSLGPLVAIHAGEWERTYPPGTGVEVHYSPAEPRRSALWPEGQSKAQLRLVSVLLALGAFVVLRALWFWPTERVRKQSAASTAEGKVLRRW
jgi:hypothetical protein